MKTIWKFCYFLLLFISCVAHEIHFTTEVFVMPIEPILFNWTSDDRSHHFTYRTSLLSAPDLPSWIHYTHSKAKEKAFLYGVPPTNQDDLELQIVGVNRKTYEARHKVVLLEVKEKVDPAKYEVQLKIDNLNVEDMFDEHRMNRLLDVFRNNLWLQSHEDLYVTFLESAVQLGARLPLSPNEREGVVLKLGSKVEFSAALIELQEEVKPLWKLVSCPRDFKRTTVDRFFRDEGFALDWCAFRLATTEELSSLKHFAHNEIGSLDSYGAHVIESDTIWSRPSKDRVPQRSYVSEFVSTILVPMMVMIVLVLILSLILCFHHEGMDDVSDEFFESLFDICEQSVRTKRNKQLPAVQMVQYTAVHRATNTLRSLSNQREVYVPSEVTVPQSQNTSPADSLPRTSTTRSIANHNSYYRPQPPPYNGGTNGISDRMDF